MTKNDSMFIRILPLFLLGGVFISTHLQAQPEGIIYDNYVYDEHIKSVQLTPLDTDNPVPLIELDTREALLLSFDELEGEGDRYNYTVILCNQDWTKSDLDPMEYMGGFTDDTIDDYEYSDRTVIDYVHYELELPNEDVNWTKSGNYLLVVYDDDDNLLLTKRFMVVSPVLIAGVRDSKPTNAAKIRTYQEFDFEVNNEISQLKNPQKFLTASVLQNGRWDNALTGIPPAYVLGDRIVFDYQDQITFRAGKEFRLFDTRSLRFPGTGVEEVLFPEGKPYEAILFPDFIRNDQSYLQQVDFNGEYFIINDDSPNSNAGVAAEYTNVFFTLKTGTPFYGDDVYVLGAFNDWRCDRASKMIYNDVVNGYVAKILLKQGVYDYAYATLPSDEKKTINRDDIFKKIEGDSYQTENSYLFLFYYRPLGARYDDLIGYRFYPDVKR